MDTTSSTSLTLSDLRALYLAHAQRHYRRRSGDPTREHLSIRAVLDRFARFAGEHSSPARINRHQVRAWLDQLAAEGLARSYVNACLGKLRRFVRWSADLEHLPIHVDHELRLVRPLQPFRSPAKEAPRRRDLEPADVAAIAAHMPAWSRDVIHLLTLTAARPSEIVECSNAEIHLDARPRITPLQHKTAHKGKHRVIPLSPAAVRIVERHWRPFLPADALFRTRAGDATMNALEQAWCRARRRRAGRSAGESGPAAASIRAGTLRAGSLAAVTCAAGVGTTVSGAGGR